jgi:hypothetical protein
MSPLVTGMYPRFLVFGWTMEVRCWINAFVYPYPFSAEDDDKTQILLETPAIRFKLLHVFVFWSFTSSPTFGPEDIYDAPQMVDGGDLHK